MLHPAAALGALHSSVGEAAREVEHLDAFGAECGDHVRQVDGGEAIGHVIFISGGEAGPRIACTAVS